MDEAVQKAVQKLIDDGTYLKILKYWGVEDGAIETSEINTPGAAGIARAGGRPVLATSATFFQRTFDQLQQELALNHVPTQDKQQSAHQCQVKISAILGRRNERTQQLLDVELCGGTFVHSG